LFLYNPLTKYADHQPGHEPVMERLVIIAKEKVISAEVIETMLDISPSHQPKETYLPVEDTDSLEKTKILRVLEETNYNQKEASKRLGTFYTQSIKRNNHANLKTEYFLNFSNKNLQHMLQVCNMRCRNCITCCRFF